MTDIDLLAYLLTFMLSVFFSGLAVNRTGPTFSFLSWITWYTFAILHLMSAFSSNFLVLVWLFFGLGTIFLIVAIVKTVQSLRGRIATRREREQWELM